MRFRHVLVASTALLAFNLPAAAFAADDASKPIGTMTHKDLEAFIKQYLIENPELIADSMQNVRKKQMEEMKLKGEKALKRNNDALTKDPSSPSIGPKDADVTVIEFFDYHCGYCKHMLPAITKIMKEDPKVRFVFKEFPILSEDSVAAAKAALAVWKISPDKYMDFHAELMKYTGRYDEKTLSDFAGKLGISKEKLQQAIDSEAVKQALKKNRELAMDMEIHGTPAFVIGDNFMPGALEEDQLKEAIKAAREGKKLAAPETKAPPQ